MEKAQEEQKIERREILVQWDLDQWDLTQVEKVLVVLV